MAAHPEEGTSAVDDKFFETEEFHNRTFQSYAINNLPYLVPSDEDEIDRLNNFHSVLNRVFDGRLIFPPVHRPRRILDCGCGTGAWASEVAEQNPQCEVLGIDINPMMQPDDVPDNLYLQVDDFNQRFTFPAHNFDLVNSRMVSAGLRVNGWPQYLQDLLRVIRPGGWAQMVDLYCNAQSDNGSLTDGHALSQWSARYRESMQGRVDLRAPLRLAEMMREAGFVDVEHRMIQLPMCAWATDQRETEIGNANRENIRSLLSSLAIYPFTEILGMPLQDVHLLVAQARLEASDPALKVKSYRRFLTIVCLWNG
ncbi:related to methyltransferase [Rhynchosporium graminicola]|uniref:Related to methyltransferase n=1 Tax=Rhynchosporium graminicola TaxID=2792576 RepID=A0A1E1KRN0_9HELO|nr:related to methyltransferase [Rhynchosporium commune]